jgi:GNAT superfamily N-acetyltransferase
MIEPWSPQHAQGAIDVVKSVFDEYNFTWDPDGYHADLYDVPTHYLQNGDLFFVSVQGDQVVGTVAIEFFESPVPGAQGLQEVEGKQRLAGTDCALLRLYVRPEARGQGIGGALIETVKEKGAERGNKRMEIWSDKRFTDAHRLYQKLGARIIGDRICDDPDVSPEWGLILDL